MKYIDDLLKAGQRQVAPFVGAWIEIILVMKAWYIFLVAPFVGAWIEIKKVRWFKCLCDVAPFVGAWIEIMTLSTKSIQAASRSLRGSVD